MYKFLSLYVLVFVCLAWCISQSQPWILSVLGLYCPDIDISYVREGIMSLNRNMCHQNHQQFLIVSPCPRSVGAKNTSLPECMRSNWGLWPLSQWWVQRSRLVWLTTTHGIPCFFGLRFPALGVAVGMQAAENISLLLGTGIRTHQRDNYWSNLDADITQNEKRPQWKCEKTMWNILNRLW